MVPAPTPRVGICLLPEYSWAEAAERWRRIEQLGAAHGWTYDHITWGGLPDSPWRSTFPFLTAAAMVTTTLPLGTFVASPNFRHPALLAKDAVTLDDISGGRTLLGVGAGGNLDAHLLGKNYTRAERTRRFAEFVPLLQRLLTEDTITHDGEFYTVNGARGLPGSTRPGGIPLLVAANGPKAMRLAAEYGRGWVTTGPQTGPAPGVDNPDQQLERWWLGVAEMGEAMTAAEVAHRGPDAAPLLRYLSLDFAGLPALSSLAFAREQISRAGELGFTDVIVHWPRPTMPYRAEESVLEELFS